MHRINWSIQIILSITVWTFGVHWRRILSPALADQLVQSVAKVLHLAGPQHAAHTHQLGVVLGVEVVGVRAPQVAART